MTSTFLAESYDSFPRIEEAFQAALDESLRPRGPDLLFDIVAGLRLPPVARVLDLGCGEGKQSIELAKRFRFAVHGIDPVPRQLEVANATLEEAAKRDTELRKLVRFEAGAAESVPAEGASVDLIWCRETLYFFDLDKAFAECRRVLRAGGYMLIYHNFGTDRLDPREAEWWHGVTPGTVPANSSVQHVEAAIASAGLQVDQCIELGTEFGEYSEETMGKPSQQLIHAARLLRAPERYVARFGQANYDIMLADCFWHINRMIGKLSSRVYLLRAP